MTPVESENDQQLIASARAGNDGAYAELWRRHFGWAVGVASRFTRLDDGEDVASEAITNVFRTIAAGRGPDGPFRPYLFTAIRHLAIRSSGRAEGPSLESMGFDIADEDAGAFDPEDRELLARAFRSLPQGWQEVLWRTEVDGMEPREIANAIGASPNAVAALSYRAREGLRRAWLRAHITHEPDSEECRWIVSQIPDALRDPRKPRQRARYVRHLNWCGACRRTLHELEDISLPLGRALAPWVTGAGVGGLLVALLRSGEGVAIIQAVKSSRVEALFGWAPGTVASVGSVAASTSAVVALSASLLFADAAAGIQAGAPPAPSTLSAPADRTQTVPAESAGAADPAGPDQAAVPLPDIVDLTTSVPQFVMVPEVATPEPPATPTAPPSGVLDLVIGGLDSVLAVTDVQEVIPVELPPLEVAASAPADVLQTSDLVLLDAAD